MGMRAAIIGCGGIAQVHAAVLANLPGVELVACGDLLPERAVALAAKYGGTAYDSLAALLAKEEIDVLHICTPHSLHTEMAKMAIKKGMAVFTEKPPAIDRAQWTEFAALKGSVGICFQNRYNKSVQFIKSLLPQAGRVRGARAFVTWSRGESYYLDSGWRGRLATEGGGVLMNQSVHTLDLLVYLLGAPKGCEASFANRHLKGKIEVEDTLEAYIQFETANALFYATTAYSTDAPVLLELDCAHMCLRMEENRVTILHQDKTREEHVFAEPEALGKAYWGNGHYTCIGDFYKKLAAKAPAPIGIPQVTDTLELLLSIYEQCRALPKG